MKLLGATDYLMHIAVYSTVVARSQVRSRQQSAAHHDACELWVALFYRIYIFDCIDVAIIDNGVGALLRECGEALHIGRALV